EPGINARGLWGHLSWRQRESVLVLVFVITMQSMKNRTVSSFRIVLLMVVLLSVPGVNQPRAQAPWPNIAPLPANQRQLLQRLQSQLSTLDDAIQNSPRLRTAQDAVLWNHFGNVRASFQALTQVLSPAQVQRGANDLAELDAGLAIISEAFANYEE